MRLVDSVVSVDECSAITMTCFDAKRDWLKDGRSQLASYIGVELIAQSAALPLLYMSSEGEAHSGMIVQVKIFQSHELLLRPNPTLQTKCNIELALDGTVAIVKGEVLYDGEIYCEGTLLLSVQSNR